ncbi:hypothetical protein Q5X42_05095 [Acinetobacter baumannii]|nr:hypothetical protein [Acinetobacter baumannii]
MSWLSFRRIENGNYRFEEGNLAIEYDSTGLVKVFKFEKVVHTKQFNSPTKAILGVELIYNQYKA